MLKGIQKRGWVPGYQRAGIYEVDVIHALVGSGKQRFGSDLISMDSARYRVFSKSVRCVRCGCKGVFYAKERNARYDKGANTYYATNNDWHFNLYARVNGRDVLMTKDHIIPRTHGGPDTDDNYQTMCSPCNSRKGSKREGPLVLHA